MLNELYRQKYLKYKAKYLELRDQSGGVDLYSVYNFKNCAILKLTIKKTNHVTLELIYEGESNKKKKYYGTSQLMQNDNPSLIQGATQLVEGATQLREKSKQTKQPQQPQEYNYLVCTHNNRLQCFIRKYFITSTDTNNNILDTEKNTYNFGIRTCKLEPLLNINSINYDINIYIIRHGEGTHNLTDAWSLIKKSVVSDPRLTDAGKNQAKTAAENNAGNILNNIKFNGVFSSKLKRTRETIVEVLKNNKTSINKLIVVLPCAHELKYKDDGNCDGRQLLTTRENKHDCSKHDCLKEEDFSVDWNFFNNFYKVKSKCRNYNFIQLLLHKTDIITITELHNKILQLQTK